MGHKPDFQMLLKEYLRNCSYNDVIDAYSSFVDGSAFTDSGDPRYAALGLSGETGEVVDKIKKIYYHRSDSNLTEEDREYLLLELGDVLWYWMRLCQTLGFDPMGVIDANVRKLCTRHT